MTYKELARELAKLTEEQLAQDVSIYGTETTEVFKVDSLVFSSDVDIDDILDVGHPVLLYTE
jgi:hypothetical protein